jgi:hypothetical protein
VGMFRISVNIFSLMTLLFASVRAVGAAICKYLQSVVLINDRGAVSGGLI